MTTRQFITKSGDTFEWEETPKVLAALKKLHETDYTEPTVKIYDNGVTTDEQQTTDS